jgi:hypothetical protein
MSRFVVERRTSSLTDQSLTRGGGRSQAYASNFFLTEHVRLIVSSFRLHFISQQRVTMRLAHRGEDMHFYESESIEIALPHSLHMKVTEARKREKRRNEQMSGKKKKEQHICKTLIFSVVSHH